MVLNNIFLMVNQHLFMYLLVICISSLEKYTFRYSAHFLKIRLFIFLLLHCKLLYILGIYFIYCRYKFLITQMVCKNSLLFCGFFSLFLSTKVFNYPVALCFYFSAITCDSGVRATNSKRLFVVAQDIS